MDDQELSQFKQTLIQRVDSLKLVIQLIDSLKSDIQRVDQKVSDMSVMIDFDMPRYIHLLFEGHENILERLPDPTQVKNT